jgi:hypothetical protein
MLIAATTVFAGGRKESDVHHRRIRRNLAADGNGK